MANISIGRDVSAWIDGDDGTDRPVVAPRCVPFIEVNNQTNSALGQRLVCDAIKIGAEPVGPCHTKEQDPQSTRATLPDYAREAAKRLRKM